jgi:hypothetical protein
MCLYFTAKTYFFLVFRRAAGASDDLVCALIFCDVYSSVWPDNLLVKYAHPDADVGSVFYGWKYVVWHA